MLRPEPNKPNPRSQPIRQQSLKPNVGTGQASGLSVPSPTESSLPPQRARRTPLPQDQDQDQDRPAPRRRLGFALKVTAIVCGLVACLVTASRYLPAPSVEEKAHRNWKYVQLATDKTTAAYGETRVVVVGPDRQPTIATSIGMGSKQKDTSTTTAVVQTLQQGSTQAAVNVIMAAQRIPEPLHVPVNPLNGEKFAPAMIAPVITTGMKQELITGDVNFFHLHLFDCCAEDGDVVDVVLDGQMFARVPITHVGATLSIPIGNGRVTALAVQGVHDGGGGITVAFTSSDGDAFLGVLAVDQVVPLGVVGR